MKIRTLGLLAMFVSLLCGQTHKAKTDDTELPLQLSRETPLPSNAAEALALSEHALNGDPEAKAGPDGRVVLTYGAGTPTIVCALLKVTEIDLEPGESVAKDGVDLGDTTEFLVVTRHAGGKDGYDYLILKPKAQDVETTMTVGTDKRVYYFRLRATENRFMSRVAFSYPGEAEAKALALQEQAVALAKSQAAAATRLAEVTPPPPILKAWKYSVKKKGKDADYLLPLSVADDGAHTQIQLSNRARARGLPVLQIRDATGPIPANWHWDENKLIVDALFEEGCLIQGVGKKQQRVCIHNDALGKAADGAH
jgi:type IV secretion system protein VirB9